MINIGERFISIRKLHNTSANQLSKALDIDPSTISKIENGSAMPSVQLLQKFCEHFNISMADFFNDGTPSSLISNDLRQLLDHARDLTPEQLAKLTQFIKSIK